MPYQSFVSANVSQLAGLLKNASNGKSIYLYKDNSGTIQAFESENQQNSNNTGYPYQFLNGDVVYSTFPISSITQISYDYTYSGLGGLFTSNLTLWYDGKEPKNINVTTQKILSKGYTTNEMAVENTVSNSFTYSNSTIDLSSGANLETVNTEIQRQYWTLCMVISCPTQNLTNHTIFQHNDISIRISGPRLAPDTVNNTYMISLHLNGTFKQGITFKPSDATFKYIIYCKQDGSLTVSGNLASQLFTGSFSYGSSYKVYVGQDSSGTNNSLIKVNEIFYYQSTSDNIGLSYTNFTTYLNSKWTLSTYTDAYNIVPIPPDPWSISGNKTYFYFDYADFASSPSTFTHTGIGQFSHITGTYTYVTNAADSAGRTAKKALQLSGSDSRVYYDASGIMPTTATNDYTMVLLLKFTGTVGGYGYSIIRNQSAAGIGELLVFSLAGGGTIQYYPNYATGGIYTNFPGSWGSNQYVLLTFSRSNVFSAGNGNWDYTRCSLKINGTSVASTANNNGSFTDVTLTQYFGLHEYGGMTTTIAAQYISKGQISQAQIEQVEGYIVWNSMTAGPSVTGLLPPSHPYYTAAPTAFT